MANAPGPGGGYAVLGFFIGQKRNRKSWGLGWQDSECKLCWRGGGKLKSKQGKAKQRGCEKLDKSSEKKKTLHFCELFCKVVIRYLIRIQIILVFNEKLYSNCTPELWILNAALLVPKLWAFDAILVLAFPKVVVEYFVGMQIILVLVFIEKSSGRIFRRNPIQICDSPDTPFLSHCR